MSKEHTETRYTFSEKGLKTKSQSYERKDSRGNTTFAVLWEPGRPWVLDTSAFEEAERSIKNKTKSILWSTVARLRAVVILVLIAGILELEMHAFRIDNSIKDVVRISYSLSALSILFYKLKNNP